MTAFPLMMAAAAARRGMPAASVRVAARCAARPMGTVSRAPLASCAAARYVVAPVDPRSSLGLRTFTTTRTPSNAPSSPPGSTSTPPPDVLATYEGPLARTFTRLKLFSLGSLGLASVLTPVLLLAPGEISLAGRVGLCITALATSGVSTALIAWIGTPYVGSMRLLAHNVIEINTVSWRLKPQRTLVYDPTFLRPTSRPFAAWELTNTPPPVQIQAEVEERKIAETFDVKTGTSLGSWNVRYDAHAQTRTDEQTAEWKAVGKVVVQGKPTRYFNVHEELLDEDWQVLG